MLFDFPKLSGSLEEQAKDFLDNAREKGVQWAFQDQYGALYAAISINEHTETLNLNSSRFRNWLPKIHYTTTGSVLNGEDITNVLNILKAEAEFGEKKKRADAFAGLK
jgi:hypothetical protein